jgi:hypothetical protein
VLINITQVLRIWPLRPEYLAKPEHIHVELPKGASPPSTQRQERRGTV